VIVLKADALVVGSCMLCDNECDEVWVIRANKTEIRVCQKCAAKFAQKVFGKHRIK
jgi:ribosome-binding protein aMBF1 (putative translation factor)